MIGVPVRLCRIFVPFGTKPETSGFLAGNHVSCGNLNELSDAYGTAAKAIRYQGTHTQKLGLCRPGRALLARAKGQVDLMFVRGKWMLSATCDADEGALIGADDALGIDMGIVHLAVDNSGKSYSGAQIDNVRRRQHCRRRAMQKVGTRSAKRALRRAS